MAKPPNELEPYVYFRRHRGRRIKFWAAVAWLCLIAGGLAIFIKYVHDTWTDRPPFNYEPYRELTPRSIDERQRFFKEWEARESERLRQMRDRVRRGQQGPCDPNESGCR